MSDPQTRKTTAGQVDKIAESGSELGESLVRLGTAALSAPLALLPQEIRTDARIAARDFVGAVGKLHIGIAKLGIGVLESFAKVIDDVAAPVAPK